MRLFVVVSTLVAILAVASSAAALPLTVEMRVGDGEWRATPVATPLAGEPVALRAPVPAGASVRWYELLPDLGRDHHNAEWPWNPGAYRWLGFERVACERVEIEAWRDQSAVVLPRGVPPPLPAGRAEVRPWLRQRASGTFWLQCEVTGDGGDVRRTPGLDESDARGLPPAAIRLSVRDGEGFAGWIATFANVPSMFGSTTYQSRNWLAADCADVIMTARSAWLGEALDRDWNVAGIVSTLRRRSEADLLEGVASGGLRWGRDVVPGDVVAVRYAGGRSYQHVGVLVGDTDGDGSLSPDDAVAHAGPLPLRIAPLREGSFDGHVVILDPGGPAR
jgi:hypothetical protein